MTSTSFTIQTQSQLLTAFEDGQAAGSITPQSARNLIGSVGPLAHNQQAAPLYSLGSMSGTPTILWNYGSMQLGTLANSSPVTIDPGSTGLGSNYWARMVLFIQNNTSGNGTLTWGGNVSYTGSSPGPQPTPVANIVTKFSLETIDGGSTWSIIY